METAAVLANLDYTAGEWPMDLAFELLDIATRCLSTSSATEESVTNTLVREINDVKKRGGQLVEKGKLPVPDEEAARAEESSNVPGAFLCPIYRVKYHSSFDKNRNISSLSLLLICRT